MSKAPDEKRLHLLQTLTDPHEDLKFLPPFAREMLLPLLVTDVETRLRNIEQLKLPRFEDDGLRIAMVQDREVSPPPLRVHATANHIVKLTSGNTAASGPALISTPQVFVSEGMARVMGYLPPRTGPPNRAARRKK